MNERLIRTSIASYEQRLKYEKQRAQIAITDDELTVAAMAVAEACKLKGAIEELEFLLDALGTEV